MKFFNMKRALLLIWSLGNYWVLTSLISNIILGLIPVLTLFIAKELINSLIESFQDPDRNFNLPMLLLGCQLLIALLNTLINNINNYIDTKFQLHLNFFLEAEILKKAASVKLENFDNNNFYNHLSRLEGSGSSFLDPFKLLIQILRTSITLISMLIFLLNIHWSLVVFSLIACIPMFIVHSKFGNMRFWLLHESTPDAREASYISQLIRAREASKEIRSFNIKEYLLDKWSFRTLRKNNASLKLAKKEHKAQISLDIASAFFYGGAAFIIIRLIKEANIKVGEFVVVGEAVQTTQASINSIATYLAQIYEKSLYINDYYNFMLYENESNDSSRSIKLGSLQQGIEISNLSFKYFNSNQYILKNINLSIQPGEKIAIVGKNGSGKSTLVKCLAGLYAPTNGEIFYNNINTQHLNPIDLREKFSIIFQDFMKYYFKASENIGISSPKDIDNMEKIMSKAEIAQADEFISNLSKGYETTLGNFLENGEDLSGGQWQKIAIARALFKDSEVLILDEPSSALDPITELNIYNLFNNLSQHKTTIFISHRMASARMAHRIIVMDNGRIVEQGSHDELINLNQLYAEMYNSQAKWYQQRKQEVLI